ncbi:MAG: outer membrane beta-barrel protein [Muribaculaceae bacterium]|nr:outer membrane beta-barrel protein [Muribaculaceae bacterium]
MKKIKYSFIIVACGAFASQATAQNLVVKAYGDIGLGNAFSLTTALPGMSSKSSANSFGVDFGYTFWKQGANSLEANIGVGYSATSVSFDVAELSYNYAAPASADVDGNPYQRYTTLNDVNQKINLGYFKIPIYLQYQFRATKWLGVHADLGFGLGFKCSGKEGSTTGIANSYGVYQEYDQLVIKADYLNDFGETYLDEAETGKSEIKGFSASFMAGAGLEFYVAGPVSIDLGIRYNAGLTDVFTGRYDTDKLSEINAESAPVTYTVAEGQQVKALSDYVTKSRLNPFSLHLGINVRF